MKLPIASKDMEDSYRCLCCQSSWEISERSFSNPHPRTVPVNAVSATCIWFKKLNCTIKTSCFIWVLTLFYVNTIPTAMEFSFLLFNFYVFMYKCHNECWFHAISSCLQYWWLVIWGCRLRYHGAADAQSWLVSWYHVVSTYQSVLWGRTSHGFVFHSLLIGFVDLSSEERATQPWRGYFYAGLVLLSMSIARALENLGAYYGQISGMQVRSCLMAAVYKKVSWKLTHGSSYRLQDVNKILLTYLLWKLSDSDSHNVNSSHHFATVGCHSDDTVGIMTTQFSVKHCCGSGNITYIYIYIYI